LWRCSNKLVHSSRVQTSSAFLAARKAAPEHCQRSLRGATSQTEFSPSWLSDGGGSASCELGATGYSWQAAVGGWTVVNKVQPTKFRQTACLRLHGALQGFRQGGLTRRPGGARLTLQSRVVGVVVLFAPGHGPAFVFTTCGRQGLSGCESEEPRV